MISRTMAAGCKINFNRYVYGCSWRRPHESDGKLPERPPSRWERKKLKYVASLKSGDAITANEIADSGEYPVFGGNGIRGYTSRYTHCGSHVLIGRQGALCGNINYAAGCFWASEHAVVAEITGEAEVTWLGELLRSMNLNQYSQSAAQPGLAVDVIANLEIPVPPFAEQRAIADYLDRETAQLDALMAEKERVLKLLSEKRRALITRAVTRGLDPRAPLRDSGIPWLGEIPVHWRVERLKFHLHSIEQGWSPMCDNTPAALEEWGVLKAGCVNGWNFDPSENKRLPDGVEPLSEYEVRRGDVLMSRANTTALLGSTAIVRDVRARLLMCDKLYRLGVNDSTMKREYLVAFLRSPTGRHEFERDATGASNSMQNIGQDSVRNLWVPIPPPSEQREIVARITQEAHTIETLSSATERTVALLTERRAALIAAAVAGQMDVNEATA